MVDVYYKSYGKLDAFFTQSLCLIPFILRKQMMAASPLIKLLDILPA